MRRTLLTVLLAVPLILSASPAQAATPGVLNHVGTATKVVLVTTPSWTATSGTATLWQKVGTSWRAVRTNMPVHVGRSGFKTDRREGDGSTPAGQFFIRYAFGSQPNPGSGLHYRSLVPRSCWSGERADYNRWVTRTCTSRDEDLWAARAVAYRYAAIVGFNDSPPVYGKGSGIFLHQSTGRATAGCVSFLPNDIIATMRWMSVGTKVVMGPASYVAGL